MRTGLIVTCFNSSKYLNSLRSRLSSLKNQFTELIFINDSGSDIEERFFVEFCNENNLTFSLNQKNLGPMASRLIGMENLSHIDYVMFCDVDDEVAESVFFSDFFIGFDVVSFGMEKRYSDGSSKELVFREGNYLAFDGFPTMLGRWYKVKTILPVLKQFVLDFSELRIGEDLCFILALSTLELRFFTVDNIGVINYKREGSLSYRNTYDSNEVNFPIIKTLLWARNVSGYAHNMEYFRILCRNRKSLLTDFFIPIIRIILSTKKMRNFLILFKILIRRFSDN